MLIWGSEVRTSAHCGKTRRSLSATRALLASLIRGPSSISFPHASNTAPTDAFA